MEAKELRDYFVKLDLEPEIADVYLALHTYGPQTISELSRTSGVERTRLYRLTDQLTTSNLIEVETEYKRSIFKAAPIANLHILLSKKEQELKSLQAGLESITQALSANSRTSPFTHVQFYKGPDGAKQMLWNQTKATTERICILHENLQVRTNSAFFERWVRKCNERGLRGRAVISQNFIASQQQWYRTHHNERLKHWQSRLISADIFPITHSTVVHGNVISYYNWQDGEIFGIEIYNQDIADTQRHFFEMLWKQAKPVKVKLGDKEAIP